MTYLITSQMTSDDFLMASHLRYELQRDWKSSDSAALVAAMRLHLDDPGAVLGAVPSAVPSAAPEDERRTRLRGAIAALDPSKMRLLRAFPRNHWLHKMDWSLPEALRVDTKVIATEDH
jgi:hypothetical protein